MPTRAGIDAKGHFYRFGTRGKKYYYEAGDPMSACGARGRANRQGRAMNADRRERRKEERA